MTWVIPAQGLALAVGISVLLRTLNFTIDPTLTGEFGWIGWLLGIGFGLTLVNFKWEPAQESPPAIKGVTSAAVGLMGLLTVFYFMLSSPGVIARWTEGSYVADYHPGQPVFPAVVVHLINQARMDGRDKSRFTADLEHRIHIICVGNDPGPYIQFSTNTRFNTRSGAPARTGTSKSRCC